MRSVLSIVVLLLVCCESVLVAQDTTEELKPKAVITGPREAVTGTLIKLSAKESLADHYHWLVDTSAVDVPDGNGEANAQALAQQLSASGWTVVAPASSQPTLYEIREGGLEAFLSSFPGTYRVVLAVSIDGVGIDQAPATVVVRRPDGVPPKDPPKEPPDDPDPTPDQFTELVHTWLRNVPVESIQHLDVLIEALAGTAEDFREGDYTTVEQMAAGMGALIKLSGVNYQVWREHLLVPMDDEYFRRHQAGGMRTPAEFALFLDEIADAMRSFNE